MRIDRRMACQGMVALAMLGKVAVPGKASAAALKAFDELPPQSTINSLVDVYAQTALSLSRLAVMTSRCKLDVPYGDDEWQRLDIYLPRQENLRDLPVFANIHGGGWTHGYKEWMGLNAPPIIAFPAIYVSIGYRLAPTNQHPVQLDDCLRAFAWIYHNIEKFGGSPERLHIGGHSAGAHLSSLITLRTDMYGEFGLPTNAVKACFPFNGIYDLRDLEVYGEKPENSPGKVFVADAKAAADASPIEFVTGNRTPFFVVWAENDNLLIKAESSTFIAALKKQPGRVEEHMFPGFDHFWTHIDQQRPENPWTQTLRAWMTGAPSTAQVFIA
jgi:arylformamidase